MKAWNEKNIINDNGETVEAILPFVISASRSTDIPAFYSRWFMKRLGKGYITWINPFNRKEQYVSFEETKIIVFWSKNPKPIIPHLNELDKRNIKYYFQFTLNDYEKENLEPNVPKLESRIETFIKLSKLIGKEKVIWRFDPLLLSSSITIDDLILKIKNIGNKISQYTEKLVFSFADIGAYKKVQSNLSKTNDSYREFTKVEINEFSEKIVLLNKSWNLSLATCAEKVDLGKYNIEHNRCIDDELIYRIGKNDPKVISWLGLDSPMISLFREEYSYNIKLKDKGQRKACGCIVSKDIGMYNTCYHLCTYCYANHSENLVKQNLMKHDINKQSII
jgi:DNA repair photolyase